MKSTHGKYVMAESGDGKNGGWQSGNVNAKADKKGPWEVFNVTFVDDNKVQFKGPHGNYLSANSNGNAMMHGGKADIWETFTVETFTVEGNRKFAFKSYH